MAIDNRIYPFFNEDEIKQNGLVMMLLAQNTLLDRMNATISEDKQMTKESFFTVLENSEDLRDMLREAVEAGIKSIDWDHCHDVAIAKYVSHEQVDAEKRRENIKHL